MIKLYRHAKKIKLLSCICALLFTLLNLSTAAPIHAASNAVPPILSPNWSGFVATGPLGTFTKSQCTVKVPTVSASGQVSLWCGLGGIPDIVDPQNPVRGEKKAVLVQAGVDACINSRYCIGNCRKNAQCDAAWWEIADALPVQPVKFSKGIKPGDIIHVYMQSNLRNDQTDTFLIENETAPRQETHIIVVNRQGATDNGQSTQINSLSPSTKFPIATDGASVDCVVERATDSLNGTLVPLGNFQSATIAGCDDARVNHLGLEPISSLPTLTPMDLINDNGGNNPLSNNSTQQSNAASQAVVAQPTNLFGRLRDCFSVVQQTPTGPTGNSTLRLMGHLPR